MIAFPLVFENITSDYRTLYQLASYLIVAEGALIYIQSRTKLQRILVLLICITLAMVVAGTGMAICFDGLLRPGIHQPLTCQPEAWATATLWVSDGGDPGASIVGIPAGFEGADAGRPAESLRTLVGQLIPSLAEDAIHLLFG